MISSESGVKSSSISTAKTTTSTDTGFKPSNTQLKSEEWWLKEYDVSNKDYSSILTEINSNSTGEIDTYELDSSNDENLLNNIYLEDISAFLTEYNKQLDSIDGEIEALINQIDISDECTALETFISQIYGSSTENGNEDLLKLLNENDNAKRALIAILNSYGIEYKENTIYTYGTGKAISFKIVDGEYIIESVDAQKLSDSIATTKELLKNVPNHTTEEIINLLTSTNSYKQQGDKITELLLTKQLISTYFVESIINQYWENDEVQTFLKNNWKQSDGTIPSIYEIYQSQIEQGNMLGLDPKLYELGNYLSEQEIGIYLYIYETQSKQNALDFISLFDERKKEVEAMKQITEEIETIVDWPDEILDYEESIMNLSNYISENYDEVTMDWNDFIKTEEFQEYLDEITEYQDDYIEYITEQAYSIYEKTTTDKNVMSMDDWLKSEAGKSFVNSIETIDKEELINSASNNSELISTLISKENNMTKSYIELMLQDPTEIKLKENIETLIMTKLNGLTDGIISQFDLFSKFTSETTAEDIKNQYYAAIISNSEVLNLTYQASQAEGSMLPSMIMGAGGLANVGRIWYGLSNFSQELHSGLVSGESWQTSISKSIASAALEVGFETFLGTIPFLSNSENALNSSFGKSIISWGKNLLQEGGEEALQTFISAGFNSLAYGDEFDLATLSEEAKQAFIIGAITSAELGAGELINYDTKIDTFTIDSKNYEIKHADLVNYLTEKNFSPSGTEILDFIKKKGTDPSEKISNKNSKEKTTITEVELQSKIDRYNDLQKIVNSEEYQTYMDNAAKGYAQVLRADLENVETEFYSLKQELNAAGIDINKIETATNIETDTKTPEIEQSVSQNAQVSTMEVDTEITEKLPNITNELPRATYERANITEELPNINNQPIKTYQPISNKSQTNIEDQIFLANQYTAKGNFYIIKVKSLSEISSTLLQKINDPSNVSFNVNGQIMTYVEAKTAINPLIHNVPKPSTNIEDQIFLANQYTAKGNFYRLKVDNLDDINIKDLTNLKNKNMVLVQTIDGNIYDIKTVESILNTNSQLKKNLILSVANIEDPIKKARKLYIELNKIVHYNMEFVKGTSEIKQSILNSITTFENLNKKNTIVCKGWSELFVEILKASGFEESKVKIVQNGIHRWVEINLGDGRIISADATEAIGGSIDLANCKAGMPTKGFILLSSADSGARPSKLYKNDVSFRDFVENTQNKWLSEIDKDLGYIGDNGYLLDELEKSNNLFSNTNLYDKFFGKHQFNKNIDYIFDMEIPENMDGYEIYALYNFYRKKLLGDMYKKIQLETRYRNTGEMLEPINLMIYTGDKIIYQLYSKTLGKIRFDSYSELNNFLNQHTIIR